MVERVLFFGILLFIALFILNLKLSYVASRSINFKLGVFFSIITLLFLAVNGISDEFRIVPIVTSLLVIVCMCIGLVKYIFKIFNGKVDVILAFCLLTVLICEGYTRLDPYGSFLYFIFKENINVHKIEIFAIIGFIIFLSVKIFAGIFFKKDLNFLDKKQFQVKDGKGK